MKIPKKTEPNSMFPQKVNVLGMEYTIEFCDRPSDVDIFGRQALWGQCDYWTRTIRIYNKQRPLQDVWQTLIHKILHALSTQLHLKVNNVDLDDDETLIDLLALGISDVLFRNGWIVTGK